MNARTQLLMQAREAGRQGKPCPVKKGFVSADDYARFHAWLVATTARETGADILPDYAQSEHPDLQVCRPPSKEAL